MVRTLRMDDYRKQDTIVIDTGETVHVYPVAYFEAWLRGDDGTEDIPHDVMRAIVRDWMNDLQRQRGAGE